MANFEVNVVRLQPGSISDHPDADRLSIIKVGGYVCISAKLEDGSHRYNEGDLVVYVPEQAIVPEYLLRKGFWDDEKNRGILSGPNFDRVKIIKLRGIHSQGILFPLLSSDFPCIMNGDHEVQFVEEGQDVADFLGIKKYIPPIPVNLSGSMKHVSQFSHNYDFDSIQKMMDMFSPEDDVVVTEKLHGTFMCIFFDPNIKDEELFFDGSITCTSKGLGSKGMVFMNVSENRDNSYVSILNSLLSNGFGDKLRDTYGCQVKIFGEVYGAGIQKGFGYGHSRPSFSVFDVKVGDEYLSHDALVEFCQTFGLNRVPVLYEGKFSFDAIEPYRDGKDSISSSNVREGVVIKTRNFDRHPNYGRKIAKWVSPAYLLKSTGEEFN